MKKMRKIFALLIAMVMVLGMSMSVMAGENNGETTTPTASITINSTAPTGSTDKTEYVAYEVFKADILSTGAIDLATGELASGATAGKVAYYIPATNADLKAAVEGTGLFKLTLSADETRWNVELKADTTTAQQIATALNIEAVKNNALSSKTFSQTTAGGSATSGNVDPGYYLITSSLGDKLVVQTLADVTINTKNEYPSDNKVAETASVTIGENVTYYIEVYLPANIDVEEAVVVHDTLAEQLAFNEDSVQVAVLSKDPGSTAADYKGLTYGTLPDAFVVGDGNETENPCTFHITLDTDGYAGKWIVFKYTAQLLATADADGDGYVNKEFITYSDYTTKPNEPNVKTYDFDIQKVDKEKNQLDGAVFNIFPEVTTTTQGDDGTATTTTGQGKTAIDFFAVTGGYKKADNSETTTIDATKVQDLEAGKIKIAGLGVGTYYLVEKTAPTGFNPLTAPVIITIADDGTITATYNGETLTGASDLYQIENNAGTQLPSTGGIGTTIFYIVGAILVIGAGVVLVTRRRMNVQ